MHNAAHGFLDRRHAKLQQVVQIASQDQFLRNTSQETQWRGESQRLGHLRLPLIELEEMIVDERLEGTPLHRVLKIARAIEGRDPRSEVLRDPKVARAPRDLFAGADQTRR